jgi:hypothetical protein
VFVQVKRRPGVCAFTFSTLPMVILKVLILQIVALSIYNTKDKVYTCSKNIVYFCLPFIGHHGIHIRSQLSKVLASAYPHIFICLFSVPLVAFLMSFHVKTGFPLP